jgi:hypothetical protein
VGKGGSWMTAVIGSTEGHYEVHKTSYGEDYVSWCHGCVVVECDCGKRPVLSASETVCGCGTDHAALVSEVLSSQRATPMGCRVPRMAEGAGREYLLSEETYWLELS